MTLDCVIFSPYYELREKSKETGSMHNLKLFCDILTSIIRLNDPEEALLMSTLRDMNLSKLVAQDVPLFLSLISDLFPALGMPIGQDHAELKKALASVVESGNLIMVITHS